MNSGSEEGPALEDAPVATARRRLNWPLWLGALILIALIGWIGLATLRTGAASASRPRIAKVGQPAPEIKLRLLEDGKPGRIVTLSELAGKPVVINFWATWCQPCRQEFPALESKYRQYKDTPGLALIGIDSQGDSGPAAAAAFMRQMGATFPIWLDEDGSAEETYRVDALPTTVFIDRQGIIQDLIVGGPITVEYLQKELNKIF